MHSDEVFFDGEQFIFHELADDSKKSHRKKKRIMISDERFFLLNTVFIKVFYST